jgi:LPXTG-site transpeptidase (sortase) family protein
MNFYVQPSRDRARFILKFGQYLCLALASACFGIVALSYARARIFQSYQSWRFDQTMKHSPPSQRSLLMGWFDQALSGKIGPLAARLGQARWHDNLPDLTGGDAVPSGHSTPPSSLIGRLEIPKLGISVMVLEGDGEGVLGKAVGHVPATALPGGAGNVVIAGHRDTFFRALRNIQKNDEITFTTTQGIYNYRVGSIEEVGPHDVDVLRATGRPLLTLITCYPFDFIGPAPKRFVVQAEEIQSSQIAAPGPSLAGAGRTLDTRGELSPTSSTRPAEWPQTSTHSAQESSPTRTATNLAGSAETVARSEPVRNAAGSQPDDPPVESPSPSPKKFMRIRALLESISRHLRQG